MKSRVNRASIALVLATCTAAPVFAQTAAYWRHEEGSNGGLIPPGDDTVLDSSGNGNHMRTFDPTFTSATYTDNVSPLPLRSGLPNTLALNFGPGGDGPDRNDDNYTAGKPINNALFSAVTFELAFNMNSIGGYQALFGEDGKPLGDEPEIEPDSPVPPLKIMIRGDDFPDAVPNQLFIEWIDGDGDIHFLSSGQTTTAGNWNHIAFTLTATTAELWVAGETGDYTLLDSLSDDFAGPAEEVIIFEPLGYSIGRGMFNNGVTDWADAIIDEVRITEAALTPEQFLFVPAGPLAGDANLNGIIDADDFAAIDRGRAMGLTGFANGDFNNDGTIDAADYALINSSFAEQSGYGAGLAAAISVPEPSLAAGALITLLMTGHRRRRA